MLAAADRWRQLSAVRSVALHVRCRHVCQRGRARSEQLDRAARLPCATRWSALRTRRAFRSVRRVFRSPTTASSPTGRRATSPATQGRADRSTSIAHALGGGLGARATVSLRPMRSTTPASRAPAAESADLRRSLWCMSRRDVPGRRIWLLCCAVLTVPLRALATPSSRDPPPVCSASGWRRLTSRTSCSATGFARRPCVSMSAPATAASPRAVSVDNHGQQSHGGQPVLRSISADGRVIVYHVGLRRLTTQQVWARVGGCGDGCGVGI